MPKRDYFSERADNMNLTLVKKLEDLKEKESGLRQNLQDADYAKRQLLKEQAVNEFVAFFDGKGFTTSKENTRSIIASASYKEMKVELLPVTEQLFGGGDLFIKMNYPEPKKHIVIISSNQQAAHGGITQRSANQDPNNVLTADISKVEHNIERMQKRLADFNALEWVFSYREYHPQNSSPSHINERLQVTSFGSMNELLISLFT